MNRVKELRKAKGLSQLELAKAVNVHQTAVSQWENGKTNPDMATLQLLSAFLGVSTDMLLGLSVFNEEQIDTIKENLDFIVASCNKADSNDFDKGALYRLVSGIMTGEIIPTIDDILRISDESGYSIDEILGHNVLPKEQEKKLATISSDEREELFVNLFGAIPKAKQEEAIRYLRYLASTAEDDTP